MLAAHRSDGPRWARGQKFSLSITGVEADEAYRAAVTGARGGGRPALDAALTGWATPRQVAPGDGVLLAELKAKARGLADLTRALEGTGIAAADVRLAIDRLVKAGLVELVPLPSQEREPVRPPPRW